MELDPWICGRIYCSILNKWGSFWDFINIHRVDIWNGDALYSSECTLDAVLILSAIT